MFIKKNLKKNVFWVNFATEIDLFKLQLKQKSHDKLAYIKKTSLSKIFGEKNFQLENSILNIFNESTIKDIDTLRYSVRFLEL